MGKRFVKMKQCQQCQKWWPASDIATFSVCGYCLRANLDEADMLLDDVGEAYLLP